MTATRRLAAVVALALVAAACSTSSTTTTASSTTSSTQSASSVRTICRTDHLSVTGGSYREAGGAYSQTFTFHNVSDTACRLGGWPIFQAVDARGLPSATRIERVRQGAPYAPAWTWIALSPRHAASFDVYGADWDAVHNSACPKTSAVLITPPGDMSHVSVNVKIPACEVSFDVAPVVAGSTDPQSWSEVVGSTSSTTATSGTVTGTLRTSGGAAPGTPRPVPGKVTITNASSGVEYHFSTGPGGRFTFTVPPGTYRIAAKSPATQGCANGHCQDMAAGPVEPVRVRAGTKVRANLYISIK